MARRMLEAQASGVTKKMLIKMKMSDVLKEKDGRILLENRKFIDTTITSTDTVVLSPHTALAKVIVKSNHDKHNRSHSRSIAADIKNKYFIPTVVKLLEKENDTCPACKRYR